MALTPNTQRDMYKKSGTSAMCPYRFLVGMARRAVRGFHPFRCRNGITEGQFRMLPFQGRYPFLARPRAALTLALGCWM